MRRSLALLILATLLAADTAGGKPAPSWAHRDIALVVSRGLMATDIASFRPDDPLTQAELGALVAGLTGRPVAVSANPDAPVTLSGLNAQLVRALGLQDAAGAFERAARAAGLAPPTRFGTEVVASLLALRTNHPAAQESLELLPGDTATRAEAAYSAARILRLSRADLESVRSAASSFTPPSLDAWQRRILGMGVRFVGFPYVWGGESERVQGRAWPLGPQVQGGFDCSGLVWRVYKLEVYPEGAAPGATLRGRTTFELSAEVAPAGRIPLAHILPGDLLFFGAKGARSKAAQIDHMSIYVGNGWMLHSSRYGVTLAPLAGWFRKTFAWARRPLAEAGFSTPYASTPYAAPRR